jgi:apolipoprotein N-acyltransferase
VPQHLRPLARDQTRSQTSARAFSGRYLLTMNVSLAFLLGALCTLGFAPFGVLPAPTFSLLGLLLLWQRAPSAKHAALLGLAWGLGCFLTGVSWVYVSLHTFGGMAMPLAITATFLFCLLLATFPALAGGLFLRSKARLASTAPMRQALLFAALWTLTEWLRGTLFTGFPWLAAGYSQTPPSPLAGWSAVLGVYGVSGLVALLAGLLAVLFKTRGKSIKAWSSIVFILANGAVLRQMDWTQPSGKPLTVALLQGNVAQSLKWDPNRLALSIDTYTRLAQQHPAELTILPETALPLMFNEVPLSILQGFTHHGAALIGAPIATRTNEYTNGAVLLQPTFNGAPGQVSAYAKRHLVPFGEYAPPGFAWFFQLVNIPMSSFSAGAAYQAPLILGEHRIAPNICYEDLFGEEIISSLPHATLLINLSNTAWFGDSLAQPQHLQIAQMRAMETGRTLLRATNTGMTAMITPKGIVAARLAPFSIDALTVSAQGYQGLTPYARWGNTLALMLCLLALIPVWRGRRAH